MHLLPVASGSFFFLQKIQLILGQCTPVDMVPSLQKTDEICHEALLVRNIGPMGTYPPPQKLISAQKFSF